MEEIEKIVRGAVEEWANSSDYYDQDEITDTVNIATKGIEALITKANQEQLEELRSKVETLPRFSPDSHGFANDNPHGAFVEIEDIKQTLTNLSKESR